MDWKQLPTYVTGSVDQDLLVRMDVRVATDFFTTEVWTGGELVTCDVVFFKHSGSRQVHIAGVTPHPHAPWIMQIARNMTMADWGFFETGQSLIYDRDGKFCPVFQQIKGIGDAMFIRSSHIRLRAMPCSFLDQTMPERVKERSSVTNGSVGC